MDPNKEKRRYLPGQPVTKRHTRGESGGQNSESILYIFEALDASLKFVSTVINLK